MSRNCIACRALERKGNNGNCPKPGQDDLPVQCVGSWCENKYFYLDRYLKGSKEARRKFYDKGNAVYIDLFAGNGKGIIRESNKEIEAGSLRIFRQEVPFNEYHFFDISNENTNALKQRIKRHENAHVRTGDSNLLIHGLVERLKKSPYDRYHFAYLDPFAASGLKFETVKRLAQFPRMDLLINFPIGFIKRNFEKWTKTEGQTILDDFLGTSSWRERRQQGERVFSILVEVFKEQLLSIGFPEEGLGGLTDDNTYRNLSLVGVTNSKNVPMYFLVLASKHRLAAKIWNSLVAGPTPGGQTQMRF